MGVLKTRKNKKFNYEPRYYQSNKEGSPFQIEYKFDKFRNTVGASSGFKSKFKNAFQELKNKDRKVNRKVLLIAGVLFVIFLYLIDFDLTIFTQAH